MIDDARREVGRYVCSRYACPKVSEVLTELGGMCVEHSSPLMFPLQHPYVEAKEEHKPVPLFVPWEFMRPHERQARINHDQTLARLAERGGLDVSEALAILKGQHWKQVEWGPAVTEFLALLAAWEKSSMKTVTTKPTDAELEHLFMAQYSHRNEDVLINGNLLYELLKEVRESRQRAK
jgi:hypothetical protein